MRSTRLLALSTAIIWLGVPALVRCEESVAKLIKQLDNEEFAVREDAQRVLRQIGKDALPGLTTSLQTASLEAAARIKLVIADIEKDLQAEAARERERRAVVRVYYVKDLLEPPGDYAGPSLVLGDGIDPRLQRNRSDDRLDEKLIALVKSTIEPHSWEGEHFTVGLYRGVLIVTHTPEIQEQIAALLKALRVEAEPQMTIECVLLRLKDDAHADQYSAADFASYLRTLPAGAQVMTSRLACANTRRAVALDGKQIEYIAESRVYSQEGGGMTNSIESRQCLEGTSLSVFPRLNNDTGAVNVELRFSRTAGLALRDIGELEKFITAQSTTIVPLVPANAARPATDQDAKPEAVAAGADRSKIKWALPSSEIQLLNTDVAIPRDTWVCAGKVEPQRKEGMAAAQTPNNTGEYLYVHVLMSEPKATAAK